MSHKAGIDFSMLLASAAHDMKNSLSMILTTLDELGSSLDSEHHRETIGKPIDQVRYEAKRLNNDLISLLTLYKLEQDHINPSYELHSVSEFLEDQLLYHHSSLQQCGIDAIIECDEMLEWAFDYELLGSVVNNLVNNALRYSNRQLKLSAALTAEQLHIQIEDDGPGYPQEMLDNTPGTPGYNIDFKSGSTGLGLHFAQVIAESHHIDDQHGRIALDNHSTLGGSRFSIFLPNI